MCVYGVKPFTTLSPRLVHLHPWCLLFNIYLGLQKSVLVMGGRIQIQFLWFLVFSYNLFGNKTFKLVTIQTSQLIMDWEGCWSLKCYLLRTSLYLQSQPPALLLSSFKHWFVVSFKYCLSLSISTCEIRLRPSHSQRGWCWEETSASRTKVGIKPFACTARVEPYPACEPCVSDLISWMWILHPRRFKWAYQSWTSGL